ncbi:MAG: cobalt ECF transporter S component CbiM [Methanobacterium sp.]|nr:cobalt ECF transporter S component CbiM [Methanobacterium sp.]
MHIMENFLPLQWCFFWYLLTIPVVVYGIIQIKDITEKNPESKPLLAVSGAFIFILSSIRLPSITVPGSTSHPTGIGLGAVFFGPTVTCVLASIVLVFQALLLAHGGITTLGANIFSMGIIGPFTAWLTYKTIIKTGLSSSIAIFFAAFTGDIFTYITTAFQLAFAFPIPNFNTALFKFIGIYAITQIPISIAEAILFVIIFEHILKLRPDILRLLKVIGPRKVKEII